MVKGDHSIYSTLTSKKNAHYWNTIESQVSTLMLSVCYEALENLLGTKKEDLLMTLMKRKEAYKFFIK